MDPERRYFRDPDIGEHLESDLDAPDFDRLWDAIASELPDGDAAEAPRTAATSTPWWPKLMALAAAALLGVAIWLGLDEPSPRPETIASPERPPRDEVQSEEAPEPEAPAIVALSEDIAELRLEDGSRVRRVRKGTRARLKRLKRSSSLQSMRLLEGAATFEVSKRPERQFVVLAHDVEVAVLGTTFSVETLPGDRVLVSVQEGRVSVKHEDRRYTLRAGDELKLPPEPSKPVTDDKPKRKRTWMRKAKRGDYRAASKLLLRDPRLVRDNVEELMLAADTMRRSGKIDEAIAYLDRIIARHRRDRRIHLARFTKARLLMQQRRKLDEAARLFSQVASSRGAKRLRHDALAREVEAWHRAGNYRRARQRALDYQRAFPKGDRLESVQQFGGLKD